MKKVIQLFSILILFFFITSCSKDENTLDGFFSSLNDRPQKFTVNADSMIVITTARNSKIIFQPASFKDAQGNPVSGNVDVFVKELFKKGDFIRNNRPTISYSFLLKSGGALMVKVYQNEREVFLDKPAQILLPGITGEPDSSMSVFFWKPVESDSLLNQNPWLEDGTWTLAPPSNSVNIVENTYNTPGIYYYYSMVINELNWINCDAFYSLGQPMVELTVQTDLPIDYYNTKVFVIFQTINSVLPVYLYNNNPSQFSEFVPPGIPFQVLAIRKEDTSDLQYVLTNPVTLNSDGVINLEFQPTTHAELLLLIDNL